MMPLPDELVNVPSGKLKQKIRSEDNGLVKDTRLLSFFEHDEVRKRLGSFHQWVERIPHCQLSDGEYCDKNLTTLACGSGEVRLCWHHDNLMRDRPSKQCLVVANRNLLIWGIERIKHQLRMYGDRVLSLVELCWWAVTNDVYEHLPQSIVDEVLGVRSPNYRFRKDKIDDAPRVDNKQLLANKVKVIQLTVDPEPPAMFMARPKERQWSNENYLKFVRSLPCVITGKTDDIVAHHLIGHGEGKMGGKAHDLFTMPLHVDEHRKFHDDPTGWESMNGSQLYYVKQTIKKALDVGVLVIE